MENRRHLKEKYTDKTDLFATLPSNQKTIFKNPENKPIHWVDIDGDGIDELIYSSVCGNRGATHHFIYEYNDSLNAPQFTNPVEVRYFNPADIPQTTIETGWSWSWCGYRQEIFESIDGQYVMTEVSISDIEKGKCITETFKKVSER